RINVLDYDTVNSSAEVALRITTHYYGRIPAGKVQDQPTNRSFNINYFDFPLIDNTRLDNDTRLAVVLECMGSNSCGEPGRIEFQVVYFPGSRASLKEEPYFDEIIKKMIPDR